MRSLTLTIFAAFLLSSLSWAHQYPSAGGSFNFPTVQSPISDGGNWISANAVGTHYGDVAVATIGRATSTQITDSGFTDATAIVAGVWGPNQTVTATTNFTLGIEENEIRLRTFFGASGTNSIFGYELNFTNGYVEIVRWDGFSGGAVQFSLLIHDATNHAANGETVTATVGSSNQFCLTTAIKSTCASDSLYLTGSPGIGLNTFTSSGGANSDHWFSSFSATDGQTVYLWSNQIDDTRAVYWGGAGISQSGVLPDSAWTQCSTVAPYNGNANAINTAITNCGANQYVQLQSGTYNLTTGISFSQKNNVALRGAGADLTNIIFTGAGAGHYNSVLAMEPSALNEVNGSEQNVCDWTAGYARGTNVLTLSNCGSTTPAKGALSNLKVGSVIIGDQLDEGNDTGTIWNCLAGVAEGGTQCANNPTGSGGEARNNGTCNASPTICFRSQQQGFVVTAINGSQITVSPPIYMSNWRTGQKPQVWFATSPITSNGVENLSITATSAGSGQSIVMGNCNGCWVSGVRSVMANRSHVRILFSTHYQIQNNYLYGNISHATVSYGVEMFGGWDGLIVNNIFQQSTDSEPSCSGACEGNVIAYNFDIDNVYVTNGWEQAGNYLHASGTAFNLWEGNVGDGYNADDVHGTHVFDTVFRNYLIGLQYAGCGTAGNTPACTLQTTPIILQAGARYFNIIGNVLGKSGFHTNYTCNATSTATCTFGNSSIFVDGYTGNGGQQQSAVNGFCGQPGCTLHGAFDPQVGAYLLRWGNYDTVNAANRFLCSEVPSSIASFSNACPANSVLPPSYYYASKPTWWPSAVAWPPIGPDVTGGTATGSSGNTAWVTQTLNGHANDIPAQLCFKNIMAGPADGTGSVLTFNADNCYANTPPPPPNNPPAPATGLFATISNLNKEKQHERDSLSTQPADPLFASLSAESKH